MNLLRRLILFCAAFILTVGVIIGISRHAGIFEVAAIPVEVFDDQEALASAPVLASSIQRDVEQRLNQKMKPFLRHKIWELDLTRLREIIAADQWVKSVFIEREFPSGVRVRVATKRPLFMVETAQGKLVPMTEDASILNGIKLNVLSDIPILKGEYFLQDVKARKKAIELTEYLPLKGPLSLSNIAEISYNDEGGYTLMLIDSHTLVHLGDERLKTKVMRVARVVEYLNSNHQMGRVIDASFAKKVLVRLRKGP